MRVIVFIGPDGSGKSTLARKLILILSSGKSKVKVAWLRGTHTISSLFARLLTRFISFRGGNNPYYNLRIPSKLTYLWWGLEFVSVVPVYIRRYLLPALMGAVIVGERGLLDFLVWVILTTHTPKFISSIFGRFVLSLALKYDFSIYVRASKEELINRRKRMSSDFLIRQLVAYDILARSLNLSVVDTTESDPDESLGDVRVILCEKFGCDTIQECSSQEYC